MKKNQKIKPKIKRKNKAYEIDQCALYKLKGHGQLEKLLNKTELQLTKLTSDSNYRVELKNFKNKKSRIIQTPKSALFYVQTRVASLLARIITPDYLHSGVKKRSHVTNARNHIGKHSVLTLDITNYYESTTKNSVYWFFHHKLKMTSDIAGLLSEICTYNEYIPTGSPLSGILAYWASNKMFDRLNTFAERKNIRMTVFVDDITFSGTGIDKAFKNDVIKIIEGCGYKIKSSKTRLFKPTAPKTVTGVILKNNSMYVKNKQLHNINMLRKAIEKESSIETKLLVKKQIGHLFSAGQINDHHKKIGAMLRLEFSEKTNNGD